MEEDNPFAEPTSAHLVRNILDAMVGCVWPAALADLDAARRQCLILLHHVMQTVDVPISAVAWELSGLYVELTPELDPSSFPGADPFGSSDAIPEGYHSIREETLAFIAESLESGPAEAVQVIRTYYDHWDPETGSDRCMELLAHLVASLAHRAATDAILEGADDTA